VAAFFGLALAAPAIAVGFVLAGGQDVDRLAGNLDRRGDRSGHDLANAAGQDQRSRSQHDKGSGNHAHNSSLGLPRRIIGAGLVW